VCALAEHAVTRSSAEINCIRHILWAEDGNRNRSEKRNGVGVVETFVSWFLLFVDLFKDA